MYSLKCFQIVEGDTPMYILLDFNTKKQSQKVCRAGKWSNEDYFVVIILDAQWFWKNPGFTLF
jgi:hypothetical protein